MIVWDSREVRVISSRNELAPRAETKLTVAISVSGEVVNAVIAISGAPAARAARAACTVGRVDPEPETTRHTSSELSCRARTPWATLSNGASALRPIAFSRIEIGRAHV